MDDATHECVAIVAEHSIGGHLTRILDEVCARRGKPSVIRTDNGAEFVGKAMLNWSFRMGVQLKLIEPGKPCSSYALHSATEDSRAGDSVIT